MGWYKRKARMVSPGRVKGRLLPLTSAHNRTIALVNWQHFRLTASIADIFRANDCRTVPVFGGKHPVAFVEGRPFKYAVHFRRSLGRCMDLVIFT